MWNGTTLDKLVSEPQDDTEPQRGGQRENSSMVGSDRPNIPTLDNFSHWSSEPFNKEGGVGGAFLSACDHPSPSCPSMDRGVG